MGDSESDTERIEDYRDLFLLTEIAANPNPWDSLDGNTVPEAYDAGLSNLCLNTTMPDQLTCQRILTRDRSSLEALVGPLFDDIHRVLFEGAIRPDSPPSKVLVANWNGCYGEIYCGAKCRKNVDVFLGMIPYFLSYAVLSIYQRLPVPLGIAPPSRVAVSRRIVYLFTSLSYLDSYLVSEMSRWFKPERQLLSVSKRQKSPPVLLPLESLSDLVDIERRPHNAKAKLSPDSRSPVSQAARPAPCPGCLTLLYPRHGEQMFRDELRPFAQKKRAVGNFTPDLETKLLLTRARCRIVEYDLRRAKIDGAVERTSLMHRYQAEREMIEMKRAAVIEAEPQAQQKFMEQLRQNQIKGIFLEDPAITLDLLRGRTAKATVIRP
jgi:hypothetical protein